MKLSKLRIARKLLKSRIDAGLESYYNPSALLADLDEKIKKLEEETNEDE